MEQRRGISLERQDLELAAEARGCPLPGEQAVIRAELAAVHRRRRHWEQRMEELARLPDLWAEIYGQGPGFIALFSAVRPTPTDKLTATHEAYFAWPRETSAALAWVSREAEEERDLYHCGHLVGRWRRRAEDALPLAALYVDLDAGLLADTPLMPSVLVESSPGRYHAYVRLSTPLPPREGAALNQRLAHALGGDPGGWDLTQLFRIPGTVNHKYAERPVVRLRQITGQVYDPDHLARLLPPLPEAPRGRSLRSNAGELPPVGSDPPIPLSRAALAVWHGQDVKLTPRGEVDRSASLIRIARILHQAGLDRDHIVAVLAERDVALGWEKYAGRRDAEEQYHRIVDVVERGKPTSRQR